jgi:RNA polymerase sigma factor (TIGR02999 family)
MSPKADDLTGLLHLAASGDLQARNRLASAVYGQLHQIARRQMYGERPDHTLQPTALVHEAWQELVVESRDWKSRAHFYAAASQVMRCILIDHARKVKAAKRGFGAKVQLPETDEPFVAPPEDWLALDEAIVRLAEQDARQARIVEMRFFGGLSEDEIAEVLQLSPRTVKRDWSFAKLWLRRELA